MTTIRQFSVYDMLHYNNVNLDMLTETFSTYFYAKYLIKWPEYCVSLWNCTGSIQSYRSNIRKLSIRKGRRKRGGNIKIMAWPCDSCFCGSGMPKATISQTINELFGKSIQLTKWILC